jgi:hypothetical protein
MRGKRVRCPGRISAALEYIMAADEFTPGDIAPTNLDDAGRLVLVSALIEEGLLEVVE